jgi:hypothetical protein
MHLLIYGMQTKLPSRPGTKAAKCVDFRCAAAASFRCMRRPLPPPIITFSRQLSHFRHAVAPLMRLPPLCTSHFSIQVYC